MSDSLILKGEKYISSRRAAEITGYTRDYVGQLCREKKIKSSFVGRGWFVNERSLLAHKNFYESHKSLASLEISPEIKIQEIPEIPAEEVGEVAERVEKAPEVSATPESIGKTEFPPRVSTDFKPVISPIPLSVLQPLLRIFITLFIFGSVLYGGPSTLAYLASGISFPLNLAAAKLNSLVSIPGNEKESKISYSSRMSVRYLAGLFSSMGQRTAKISSNILSLNQVPPFSSARHAFTATVVHVSKLSFFDFQESFQLGESNTGLQAGIFDSVSNTFDKTSFNLFRSINDSVYNFLYGNVELPTYLVNLTRPKTISPPRTTVIVKETTIIQPQNPPVVSAVNKVGFLDTLNLVAKSEFETRLSEVTNSLLQKIYSVANSGGGSSYFSPSVPQPVQLLNKIDNLSGTTISSPSITGGTWTSADILSGTGSFSVLSASSFSTGSGTLTGNLTVSGTGTSTFAGDVAFDSNTLYIDSLNNRVGIGTSSPSDTLSVNGPLYLSQISAPSVTTNRLYNVSGSVYFNGTQLGGGSSGGQDWQLTTNVFNQSSLTPTTTQNILVNGTGTSTIAGGLEVWRQVAAPYFQATSTATSTFPQLTSTGIRVVTALQFDGEILPDGVTCADGEILKRTGANNWGCSPDNTSTGAADPFSFATNYGVITAATTSPIWARNGIFASSTSHFVDLDFRFSTGTQATTTNLAITSIISSLLKTDGNGSVIPAIAGQDYASLSQLFGKAFEVTTNIFGQASLKATSTATHNLVVDATGTSTFAGGLEVWRQVAAPYFHATGTAATSTFAGGLSITGTGTGLNFGSNTLFYQNNQRFLTSSTTAAGNLTIGYQSATELDANGGLYNTGVGYQALGNATSTDYNTAIGYQALKGNATISNQGFNTAVGYQALLSNTKGYDNTASGYQSLYSNTTGNDNTANGLSALYSNTTGAGNTANGVNALYSNTTGTNNTTNGQSALYFNRSATSTVAEGVYAAYGSDVYSNQGGTYVGYASGYSALTGSDYNTFLGYQSGRGVTTGARNLLLGYNAGYSGTNLTTGSDNIIIGNNIGATSTTMTKGLNIGNLIFGTNLDGTGTTLSSGNVGIGTTSPGQKLSVAGDILGNNIIGSFFTATTTTASTFPYASTTALTISGVNGLTIDSTLNGPLQANNGLVSATTSVGVLYGGTGLTTAPSYGQLLLGNAASGYTLSATSTLGLIGANFKDWSLTTNIFSQSALAPTTTQNILVSGVGTSTFAGGLEVWRQMASPYFQATSTTATSTFKNTQVANLNIATSTNKNTYIYWAGTPFLTATGSSMFIGLGAGTSTTNAVGLNLWDTAVGYQALQANTTGDNNTALGYQSLYLNTTGGYNTAIGGQSLYSNTTGGYNTAIGEEALYSNTGQFNTAVGMLSLSSNTTADENTAVGYLSLYNNTTGDQNTAIGKGALSSNTTGWRNVVGGYNALGNNRSATSTTVLGYEAAQGTGAYSNQGGVYLGFRAGKNALTGSDYNTLLGYQSGWGITTGSNNIWIGAATSSTGIANLTTGSQNILIGNNISLPSPTANGQLNIGNIIFGTDITSTGSTTSTGNIGIGTTSPYAKLSVVGEVVAKFFTATTTTASTFPYASTTALTISGVNGLTIDSTLNGPLQANNGLVSATTSVGVLYGGTGLTTAPSYGQLLLGNAASGYTLSATSTLGLIGQNFKDWNLTTNIFSQSALAPTTTQNILVSGVGTSTIAGGLEVWRQIAAPYFQATSTTATSTFVGGLTVDTNSLVVDYSSGNVGIGTAEPGFKLDVQGSSNSAWQTRIWNSHTTAGYGLQVRAGNDATNKIAEFRNVSDVAQMTILGSGNIGIGTTTPNNKLDIYSTTKSAIGFTGASGDTYKWTVGMDVTNGGRFSIASSTALGTTDRFVIDGNGNVGIGTTSPGQKLSVAGDILGNNIIASYFTATTTSTSTLPQLDTTGIQVATALQFDGEILPDGITCSAGQILKKTGDNDWDCAADGGSSTASGSDSQLQYNNGGSFGGAELFYNDANSNFGVGTSSPWGKLSVGTHNLAIATPSFVIASSSIGLATTTQFIVKNGQVGIGATAPNTEKLYVFDNTDSTFGAVSARTESTNSDNIAINATAAGAGTNNIALYGWASGAATNNWGLYVESGNAFLSGNLDFGSAGVRLSADGDGAITFLGLGNGSDENLTLNLDDTSNVGEFTSSTGLNQIKFNSMGIDADSYLAVATTSPWAKLSVGTHNLALATPSFVIASSSTGVATTTQFIVVNGKVGIGTSSPYAALSVAGPAGTSNSATAIPALVVNGGTGAAGGDGGLISLLGGAGNTTGAGGAITLAGGVAGASGAGGAVSITAGDGGVATGAAGAITLKAGDATVVGGNITLNPGTGPTVGNILLANAQGKVGVATSSPWAKLSVGTHNLAIATPSFVIASSSIGLATTTQFIVVNGNVGIGTVGPNEKLEVGGNIRFSNGADRYLKITGQPTGSGNGNSLFVQSGDGETGGAPAAGGRLYLDSGAGGSGGANGDILIGSQVSANVGVATSSPWAKLSVGTHNLAIATPSFVIASSSTGLATTTQFIVVNGNVGIGTTSPYATLSVVGEAVAKFFTATTTSTSTLPQLDTTGIQVATALQFDGEILPDGITCSAGQILKKTGDNDWDCASDATGGGGGDLEFTYGTNIFSQVSAATSSALQITSTGTSTFAGGLEVWRQVASPYFHATGTAATSTFAGGLNVDGSTFVVDYSSGNVGIGTIIPQSKLQVGTLTSASTPTPDTISLGGTYSNAAGSNSKLKVYDDGATSVGLGVSFDQLDYNLSNNTFSHVFYGAGTELLRIKGTGNVGIGTTSPYATLSVVGEAVAKFFTATTTSTSTLPQLDATGIQVSTALQFDGEILPDGDTCADGQILKKTGTDNWDCASDATGGGGGDLEFTYGTNIFSQVSAATSSALQITSTGTSTFAGGLEVWRQVASPYFHATSTTATSTFPQLTGTGIRAVTALQFDGEILPDGITCSAGQILKKTGDNDWDCASDATGGGGGSELEFTYGTNIFSQVSAATSSALQITSTGTSTFAGGLEVWRQVASPYFHATGTAATSTFAGGLNVGSGALQYDFSAGLTTVQNLEVGALTFDTDAGVVTWFDMPVTSSASAGTVESYTAQIDGNPLLTIYSQSDGSGGIQNGRVGIGTTSPSATLTVWSATTTSPVFNVISTASSTLFTTLNGGNVGIGTTSPNWSFHIASTTPYLALTDSNAETDRKHVLLSNIDGVFSIGTSTDSLSATSTALSLDPRGPAVFGIGTSSPWRTLSVTGGVAFDGLTSSVTGNAVCITTGKDITDAGAAACVPSSSRFKENITTLNPGEAMNILSQLNVVSFDYKKEFTSSEEGSAAFGLIAEEVELIDPRLVDYGYDGSPLTLHFERLTGLTIQAIQELNLNLEAIASTTATTTSASESFVDDFFSNVFSRITAWLADAANGISKLFAKEVHTDTLCISDANGETCVTKSQLDGLLAATVASQSGSSGGSSSGSTSGTGGQASSDTTPPTIVIQGNNPAEIAIGSSYADLGAVITDNQDENTTTYMYLNGATTTSVSIDTSIAGTHIVTYTAIDDAGNIASADRTVIVAEEVSGAEPAGEILDTTAPVITLVGTNPVTITQGDTYIDEGASASDDMDGNITASIITVNPVDTNTPGSYEVTYNVSDSVGNAATQVVRSVVVEALPISEPITEAPTETATSTP